MATFDELVNQVNNNLDKQRDRGTAFEKMVVAYLKNEPAYKQKFEDVWMLNEVPAEYNVSKKDTGVDIVAKDYDGNLTAIQAKFYQGKIGKAEIDSFVAEAGKDVYSAGLLVSSTDELNKNVKNTLNGNTKPFSVIGLSQLRHAHFDWKKFSFAKENNNLSNRKAKKLRPYQETAISNSLKYFKEHDRGKLVMAPGTGKTFTSLKIAEALMQDQDKKKFNVLYLVPSIQLLAQTLFNWNADVSENIHMTSLSVVSDSKANKKKEKDNDDLGAIEIGYEPTTNVDDLVNNYKEIEDRSLSNDMRVVFSTYQSIDVIKQAQQNGFPEFDLIISDEAHRTTGAIAKKEGDSTFTEVHSNINVKGKLRLYQTATPKIYDQNAKKKAKENSIVVSSMDDEDIYGKEIFRLGFGDAVAQGYLTDYKVSVLAVSESYINKDMQKIMAADNQLKVDDIGKIIGVWNAMVKRDGITGEIDGAPMKRAIAFSDTIKHSKLLANEFNVVVNEYLDTQSTESFKVDVHHVDGGLNAMEKETQIDWLGSDDIEENHARVLSNVRFLTEGIDVPNLDAIIFFSPKKSQVDIVQAVGRIMRKAENKQYGYIILPIVVADDTDPSLTLNNDKQYKQVWQVLNALRSTDERFDAEVNTLDLNKNKSKRINFIGVDSSPDGPVSENGNNEEQLSEQLELPLNWKEMRTAFYGKVVQKVGDRRYLEDWSTDVANIAEMYIRRINDLIDSNDGAKAAFDTFLKSLKYNINDSINQEQAVQMLAQHLITEPVFDALFGDYDFVKNNAISSSINNVIAAFNVFGFAKETETLKPFYESIKLRASGIDNAAGKQKLIVTLYENFFQKGFKRTTEAMGIVFTPTEVVDFIVHSVDWALNKYFDKSLSSKNVHILDPFTGTGTFIIRTLQYLKQQMDEGKITYDDILRKYMHELHANEIILLSYYIAAINIEAVFDEVNGPDHGYVPFDGIVLTDTFESTERENILNDDIFGTNNERLKKQQEVPITVIMSNPPYSAKQSNEDKNISRTKYPKLDEALRKTWIETSTATNKNGLMDSYIKALRWATDRINKNGVIGFITNSSFLDGNAMDGMRKDLLNEFTEIYIIDLKGQIRRRSRKQVKVEGGNIFDIMTGVAITILIKDEDSQNGGKLYYYNIGDGLTKKEKLNKLEDLHSLEKLVDLQAFKHIIPNKKGDWINQRNSNYEKLVKLGNKKENDALFIDYTGGIKTGRDAYSWNFNKASVTDNINTMINYYESNLGNTEVYNDNSKSISWTRSLKQKFEKKQHISFDSERLYLGMYRPFVKKYVYYSKDLVDRQYQMAKVMPQNNTNNTFISMSNKTEGKDFTSLAINVLPDVNLFAGGSQNLPMYLFDNIGIYSDINSSILTKEFTDLEEKDVLPYIYGIFHSKDYENRYSKDLAKSFPRIPNVNNKKPYIEIGKKLMDLHLTYEKVPAYKEIKINYNGTPDYRVEKMKFDKGKNDKSTIIFNNSITISNIPERAYEYTVNGKSAIEWIMDQYQLKTDKKSGIIDDPNEYSDDPKYIFNLLLSIINVSVQTVDLINQLPKLKIEE